MKVVVNTKGHYLQLSDEEMELICSLLGWTLKGGVVKEDKWFYDTEGGRVDWVQFRSHPTLVVLVEEGKLHDGLEVVEVPYGTDYEIVQSNAPGYYEEHFTYCGEYVMQSSPSKWYPKALIKCYGEN